MDLWKRIVVPSTKQGDRTSISQNVPDSLISWSPVNKEKKRGRHLELAGCLPERGMILVKLHCVGKHELDVLRKLSNIRILLPLKVFLRKGPSKSLPIVVM